MEGLVRNMDFTKEMMEEGVSTAAISIKFAAFIVVAHPSPGSDPTIGVSRLEARNNNPFVARA